MPAIQIVGIGFVIVVECQLDVQVHCSTRRQEYKFGFWVATRQIQVPHDNKQGCGPSLALALTSGNILYTATMIIRRRHLLISFLIQWSLVSAQDDPFNCHLTSNGLSFDLTKLTGEHKVSRTRDTPPSTMFDELRFDLCEDLKKLDNVADADQVGFVFISSLDGLLICE